MQKTFALAEKGRGRTSPNPIVGAVVVKNNTVIASGYHRRCGQAHAEIEALRKVPPAAVRGACLYVNLEPCSHYGRTPPCVDEIIKHRFRRVVIAVKDPNPRVAGRAIRKLRKAGIAVSVGLAQKEAIRLNEVFFKNMRKKLPFVAVKIAQSMDGRIATVSKESKWITSPASRYQAKCLRDIYDCVLVGVNTAIQDDPRLNGIKKIPYKAIIDPQLRLSPHCRLLRKNPEKVILFTSSQMAVRLRRKGFPSSMDICCLRRHQGNISVKEIMRELFKRGVMSVFVEGGSETIGRFFDACCVDKVYFFIAPKVIGGRTSLPAVGGEGIKKLSRAWMIKDVILRRQAEDFLISGYPVQSAA